jgi:hypothetical protein
VPDRYAVIVLGGSDGAPGSRRHARLDGRCGAAVFAEGGVAKVMRPLSKARC